MSTYYLDSKYNMQKSYNNKATVTINEEKKQKILKSYEVVVVVIENDEVTLHNVDQWSNTTTRHVREFLLQEGKQVGAKSVILKSYKQV